MSEWTFEAAIRRAQALLERQAAGELDLAGFAAQVQQLVATSSGARGFFVTFLSGDWPVADAVPEAVLAALRTSPVVAELMTKNLAMSTAMALAHQQRGDQEAAAGSERVARRSSALIRGLDSTDLRVHLAALQQSVSEGSGEYAAFLERWGYNDAQRQAIGAAVIAVSSTA